MDCLPSGRGYSDRQRPVITRNEQYQNIKNDRKPLNKRFSVIFICDSELIIKLSFVREASCISAMVEAAAAARAYNRLMQAVSAGQPPMARGAAQGKSVRNLAKKCLPAVKIPRRRVYGQYLNRDRAYRKAIT